MNSLDKNDIRRQAIARRQQLGDAGRRSEVICSRLIAEFPIQEDSYWLVYVSVRDEVKTTRILEEVLANGHQVVVPYCLTNQELGLFLLTDPQQLERGAFGILEPIATLRAEQTVAPEMLDTIVVPGVAFDRHGNRIGYGKGYFDRLLTNLRSDCLKIGLAFDCQIFPEIPADAHDRPVDHLITESQSIRCSAKT
ncbi:5-formyltetrahydrofolate cyclo-ligase [Blastopirellula marina]|uniref:5-formyltetrahydrofolate cyclo-ligase n=1 Tax=Blastopirellula marina TaxID=124 RepID=A0A2S8FEE5_9BACT|nr:MULTISPECIES: 5-formyltetrahydrofolate cyclo-ligase [Pirellulaceae]PQO30551.1 5-formyltetrahydrofolate cyclo-ligase [Blastopirellula marina]RCS50688.1 5-formyltetrahydrofolate cyclo-ligase [Bremerella cremea]